MSSEGDYLARFPYSGPKMAPLFARAPAVQAEPDRLSSPIIYVTPDTLEDREVMSVIESLAATLIIHWEGFRAECYDDATGRVVRPGDAHRGVLTIGYGCTDPSVAVPGNIITEAQGRDLLLEDMTEHFAPVRRLIGQAPKPLTVHMVAALWSFAFNVGGTTFANSKSVVGRIKAGNLEGAAEGLQKYVYSGGLRMRGLERRRAAEREVFLTGLSHGEDEEGARATPDTPKTDKPVITRSTEIPAAGATGAAVGVATLWERFTEMPVGVQYALIALALGGPLYWLIRRIMKARAGEED